MSQAHEAHPLDHESIALWHLELLGCYAPEDAVAPWVPPAGYFDPAEWDWDEDDWDDGWGCTHCGGEGFREVDDMFWDDSDPSGWGPCTSCRGTGQRRHQWVF